MALDFGFVESLRGRDNWALARQDKQQALLYQSAAAQQQQRELAAQEKAIADANDYLSKLKNYQVFEPDLKKIRTVEDTARKDIEAQIKAYNGDVAKWMREKGMTDLKKYGEKIVLSNEAQTGLGNAQAYAAWKADRDKGLLERFDFDEETLMPKNDFAKQFTEYTSGDRDRLEYRGAFKPNEFDDKYFSQVYGSTDRYNPKKVNDTDYFNTIARDFVQKGMNPQDARQLAAIKTANYKKHLESGGTPLLYKWDKRPAPKAAKSNQAEDAGLYIAEQLGGVLSGNPTLYGEGRGGTGEFIQTNNGISATNTPVYYSDALKGIAAGKFNYNETDTKGNKTPKSADNIIEGFKRVGDKVYIATTESLNFKGKPIGGVVVDVEGYIPVNDNIITAIAKSNGIKYGDLRKALIAGQAYPTKTPDTERLANDSSSETPAQWNEKWASLPKGGSMIGLDGKTYVKK